MASSGLKKMLFFVNFNTDGVRVLVCHAIFGHCMGYVVDVLTTSQVLWPFYWVMFPNVVFAYGRCYCHTFVADGIATVMYFYWQMLLSYSGGWCYCHGLCIAKFVADVIATVAVAVTTCGNDVSFYGRCYGHFRLMLVPCLNGCCICGRCYHHYGWWYLPFMRILWLADVGLPGCQMEQPTMVGVWSDVITMCGRWNSHWVLLFISPWVLGCVNRTSSHMWGRWYLPMFLFRDGWLTLIYMASFMVLMRFWSSLHYRYLLYTVVMCCTWEQ